LEPHIFLAIAGAFFILSLLFSLFEGALIRFSRGKLEEILLQREKKAKSSSSSSSSRLLQKLENDEDYLFSILILNTSANALFLIAFAAYFLPANRDISSFLGIGATSITITIIFMELIPRSLGEKLSEKVLLLFFPVIEFFHLMVMPVAFIAASTDPVALDRATYDLVCDKAGEDYFKKIYPSINAEKQMLHAEKMGLGTNKYRIIEL